jgi:hypothetical protein
MFKEVQSSTKKLKDVQRCSKALSLLSPVYETFVQNCTKKLKDAQRCSKALSLPTPVYETFVQNCSKMSKMFKEAQRSAKNYFEHL